MPSLIPPLNSEVEIVDSEGKPTPYFTRLLNKLTSASMAGTGLTSSGSTLALATIAAKTILANKTAGVASPTACTISDILDFISSTRGTVLFRGASSWQALAPGTAGYLLQTNGAGADPTWVIPPAGGGGAHAYEGFGNLISLAGLTKLAGASANLTLVDGTNAHSYSWTASGANTVQMAYTAAPGSTPWSCYLRFKAFEQYGVNTDFGLAIRNSTTGKITIFMLFGNGGKGFAVQEWTNATTFSSGPYTSAVIDSSSPTWLQINNDGTNLKFYYSPNGFDWTLLLTRTLATFMGSVDQVGLGGVPQVAGRAWVSNLGFTTPV